MILRKISSDKIIAGIHLVLACGYMYGVTSLSLGSLRAPGPGFFPLIVAGLWIVVALGVLVRKSSDRQEATDKETMVRLLKVSAAIVLYLVFIPFVGFSISTFFVLLYVSNLLGNKNWVKNVGFSLLGVIVCTLLFQGLLQLPLPEPLLMMCDF